MSTHTMHCRECDAALEYYIEGPQRGGPETEPLCAQALPEFDDSHGCPECGAPVPSSDDVLRELAEEVADRYIDDRDYDNEDYD